MQKIPRISHLPSATLQRLGGVAIVSWACCGLLCLSSCVLPERTEEGYKRASSQASSEAANLPFQEAAESGTGGGGSESTAATHDDLALHPELRFASGPALEPCLKVALERSLSVRMARFDREIAGTSEAVARAQFDPSADLTGAKFANSDATESNVAVQKRFITGAEIRGEYGSILFDTGDRIAGTSGNEDFYGLRVRQPLLRGGSIAANRAPLQQARLIGGSADASLRAEVYEVLRAAESAYWTAAYASLVERIQRSGITRLGQLIQSVRQKHDLGATTKVDVLELEASLATAESLAVTASKRYHDSLAQLWYVMGLRPLPPEKVPLLRLSKAVVVEDDVDADASLARANEESPTVILLANQVKVNELDVTMAKNAALPRVDAEVNWGTSPFFTGGTFAAGDENQWAALLRLSVPWTLREERARLTAARATLERSRTAQLDGMRQLERDIRETCREIRAAHKELDAATRGVSAYRAKYEERRQRMEAGVETVRTLTEAEAELRHAEVEQSGARLRLVLASALLARQEGSILERHHLGF